MSPNQWGDQLHTQRRFPPNFQMCLPHCLTYSYWDYQQAWYNTFFIQNPKKSHSWLFFFNSKITVQSLPNWFHHWWNIFGPTPQILTQNASQCLTLFKAHYTPSESEKKVSSLFSVSVQISSSLGSGCGILDFIPMKTNLFYKEFSKSNGGLNLMKTPN